MYLEVKDLKKSYGEGRRLCTGIKGNHRRSGTR